MNKYPTPQNFKVVLRFIIDAIEGGFSKHVADRGGATKFGISDARDGKHDGLVDLDSDGRGDVAVSDLTYEQAEQIYWRDYWCAARCDQLPLRMAVFVFDGAINHRRTENGGFVGAQLLQRALGLKPDGLIGPKTLERAWQYKDHADVIVQAFTFRARLYHDLTLANSSQEAFLDGWFRRLFLLSHFIHTLEVR